MPVEAWVPDRDHFPRATAEQIRRASASFSHHTSQSLDGVHPKQMFCYHILP